jgi:hypothetical protein
MKANGQLYARAVLPPGKETSVPIQQEAVMAIKNTDFYQKNGILSDGHAINYSVRLKLPDARNPPPPCRRPYLGHWVHKCFRVTNIEKHVT